MPSVITVGAITDVSSWGLSSWALAVAIWSQIQTKPGKVGLWLLVAAGIGEAMACVFDVSHDTGHGIAGLLGVGGFPVAALLLDVSLGRTEAWSSTKKTLLWVTRLSWTSVLLLVATLVLMTIELSKANGGHLPRHAPKSLPPRGAWVGWLGQSAPGEVVLLVGVRRRLASD